MEATQRSRVLILTAPGQLEFHGFQDKTQLRYFRSVVFLSSTQLQGLQEGDIQRA